MKNNNNLVSTVTAVTTPTSVVAKIFDISIFEIDKAKGLINLTKIAKYFGKNVNDWSKTKVTQDFLEAMQEESETNIIVSLKGKKSDGSEQGTWATEEVTLEFAQWISPKFKVFCIRKLKELLQKGTVSLTPQTEEEMLLQLFPSTNNNLITLTATSIRENKKLTLENQEITIQLEHKQDIILNLTAEVPAEEMRATINRIIRNKKGQDISYYSNRWNELYLAFKYRKFGNNAGIDIKIRSSNKNMKPLDYCEEFGYLRPLYELALELFEK